MTTAAKPAYEKPESIIPTNDKSRLKALYRYELLDTPPEAFFDKITRLAAKLLKMPSAFVSLVDRDRVWYKSNFSPLDVPCVDREDSLCSLTIINDDEVTVFEDTHSIPSLLSSPYVSSEGGIRFYAGAPLITQDGYNLGTVCVIDMEPRRITQEERVLLQDLASLVMEQIEMRAMARKAVRKHDELFSGLLVEVEEPMQRQEKLLLEAKHVPKPVNIVEKAIQLGLQVRDRLSKLLFASTEEDEVIHLTLKSVSLAAIAKTVADEYENIAGAKGVELFYSVASRRELSVDSKLMREAITLLVEHLLKYTPKGSSVAIDIFEDEGIFKVEISNEETTLTHSDLVRMFLRYASLEGKPSSNESSSGLELPRAKAIVERHGATIKAEATNRGTATKIMIEFPTEG